MLEQKQQLEREVEEAEKKVKEREDNVEMLRMVIPELLLAES
jgi:uncharacterized protein YeeX (DUF496 family)